MIGMPYSCEEWASEFGLTYPIVDFETGASSWMMEDLPEYFWMTNYFGLWIPSYFIIDQNIEIVSGSLTDEGFFLEITSTIEDMEGLGNVDIGMMIMMVLKILVTPAIFQNMFSNLDGSWICPPGCDYI